MGSTIAAFFVFCLAPNGVLRSRGASDMSSGKQGDTV